VRLTLDATGAVDITMTDLVLPAGEAVWRFAVSERRTNSAEPHFHHKTTARELYDGEWRRLHEAAGADEVVFLNERHEVTEGSRSSIFLERDGRWFTPPLACGVLDGCLRREIIERGDPIIEERVLSLDDLSTGQVWFGNALRGLMRGKLVASNEDAIADRDEHNKSVAREA
jgi:para-aminobenzoate synthetase/4-amino-4-deoxychorismate lyase